MNTARWNILPMNMAPSYIHDEIVWIENVLIQDGTFRLPGKKVLQNSDSPYQTVAVDATERPIERPQKR